MFRFYYILMNLLEETGLLALMNDAHLRRHMHEKSGISMYQPSVPILKPKAKPSP